MLSAFFGEGLTQTGDLQYSHRIRWRNNQRTRRFFSDDVIQRFGIVERGSGRPNPSALRAVGLFGQSPVSGDRDLSLTIPAFRSG
ncbi:MAG TPA: hypothetical protein VNU68_03380, partial [Verrucomicrobiae bacterium]|nr:hypothetical protein [Verrucomicrobiae bacterium]